MISPVTHPARKKTRLTIGSSISHRPGEAARGSPEGRKPSETRPIDGAIRLTQAIRPILRSSPATHSKHASKLSHACETTKDGYTDCDGACARLPISITLWTSSRKVEAASGEMVKILLEVATSSRDLESEARNSTSPSSACRRTPTTEPGSDRNGTGSVSVKADMGRIHSISAMGIDSTRRPHFSDSRSRSRL